MPKLPVYEQRTSPNSVGPAPRASGIPVASIGGGLNDLGRALGGIAGDMFRVQEEQREDDAAIAATTSLAEGRLHFAKRLQTLSDEWQEGSPSIYETFEKEYGDWTQKQIEAAGTDRAKAMLRERTASMRVDFGMTAFKTDRDKRIDLNVGRFDRTVKSATDLVFIDPSQREKAMQDLQAGLESLVGVPDDKKAEISRRVTEQINQAAVMGERAKKGDTAFFGSIVAPIPKGEQKPVQAPAAAPTAAPAFDTLFAAVVNQESRGVHRTKDGGLLTSPKGAQGITQVMPATGADPGYGIKPLQNDSEEEYVRFGRDYLQAMLKEFNGDTAKALAAYNAGPGRVQDAIKANGENWLSTMPKETRDYVASISKNVGSSSAGAPSPQSTPITVDGVEYVMRPPEQLPPAFRGLPVQDQFRLMQEAARGMEQEKKGAFAGVALSSAKAVVGQLHVTPDTVVDLPSAKAAAVRQAKAQIGVITPEQELQVENAVEKMVADRERDAKRADAATLTTVFDVLDKNGGDWNAAMAANPKLIGGMSREARERAVQYAGAVATGATRETDWQVYTQLVNDPALLKSTNVDALRDKLNVKEFVQLKKAQDALLNDSTAEQDIRSNLTVVKELLDQNKITDEKKQAQFYALLQQAIDSELAATGKKKLTQPEIKKKAADLLTEVVTSRGIFWDSKERAFNLEIPPVERTKIEAALIAEGLPVNDYYVNRAYRRKLERMNSIPAPTAKN